MPRAFTEAGTHMVLVYLAYQSLTCIKKKNTLQEPIESLTPYIFASFLHIKRQLEIPTVLS